MSDRKSDSTMLADWQARFPGCEPVGHRLREAFRARWVRFHSLPGSERYPENGADYATVLDRHNQVLGELVGPDPQVVLLTTACYEHEDAPLLHPRLRAYTPFAQPWRSVRMHEADGFTDPSYWHVFALPWGWRPGQFDPVVRLVADCEVVNVMMVSPDCRWLLHPYDGGMDVIAESPGHRARLQAAHRDWLSPREDGL